MTATMTAITATYLDMAVMAVMVAVMEKGGPCPDA